MAVNILSSTSLSAPNNLLNEYSRHILEKINQSSDSGKRTRINNILILPSGQLQIETKKDKESEYPEEIRTNMINDVITNLKYDGAFRFLKHFTRMAFSYKHQQHPKTKLEFLLEMRIILSLFYQGKIFPAYAVWEINNLNDFQQKFTLMNPYVPSGSSGVVDILPPRSEKEEYFLRIPRIPNLSYDDFIALRKSNIKKYFSIELQIRRFAVSETLDELYLLIQKTNPSIDIHEFRELEQRTRGTPENVSLFLLNKGNSDCKSDWVLRDYISRGVTGATNEICCENNCDYIMKVTTRKYSNDSDFIDACRRERAMWTIFDHHNLAPHLLDEIYIEEAQENSALTPYCIFIAERMDVTVSTIVDKILKAHRNDLLARLYEQLYNLIVKAHDSELIHGDCHLNNIMLKSDDKRIYDNLDKLLDNLEEEKVQMKFIDFGGSITVRESKLNVNKTIIRLDIPRRLRKLGCVRDAADFYTNMIYDVLKYYDFYIASYVILFGDFEKNKNIENVKQLFVDRMNSLRTNCEMKEL